MRLALLTIALASCVPSSPELRRPVDRTIADRLALAAPGSPGSAAAGNPVDGGASRGAAAGGTARDIAAGLDGAALDALLATPIDTATATRIALASNLR